MVPKGYKGCTQRRISTLVEFEVQFAYQLFLTWMFRSFKAFYQDTVATVVKLHRDYDPEDQLRQLLVIFLRSHLVGIQISSVPASCRNKLIIVGPLFHV